MKITVKFLEKSKEFYSGGDFYPNPFAASPVAIPPKLESNEIPLYKGDLTYFVARIESPDLEKIENCQTFYLRNHWKEFHEREIPCHLKELLPDIEVIIVPTILYFKDGRNFEIAFLYEGSVFEGHFDPRNWDIRRITRTCEFGEWLTIDKKEWD